MFLRLSGETAIAAAKRTGFSLSAVCAVRLARSFAFDAAAGVLPSPRSVMPAAIARGQQQIRTLRQLRYILGTDMSIRNPLLFDDGLDPSRRLRDTATTQNPEARFSDGIDGATLAAFELALGFYGIGEQGFIRRMIDRLIHHHQNFTELEWPLDFAVKNSVSFGLERSSRGKRQNPALG